MALESASYISDLVTTNPAGTDGLDKADDHIRLIKAVLKATFPNLNAAVTATPSQLNGAAPVGSGMDWYTSTPPSGWLLCNGQAVSRVTYANLFAVLGTTFGSGDGSSTFNLPNFTDRVPVGAGGSYALASTGGSATATGSTNSAGAHTHAGTTTASAGDHNHGGSVGGTAITQAQLPNITINGWIAGSNLSGYSPTGRVSANAAGGGGDAIFNYVAPLSLGGTGATHTHTVSSDGAHTHTVNVASDGAHTHTVSVSTIQPYLAIYKIIKY